MNALEHTPTGLSTIVWTLAKGNHVCRVELRNGDKSAVEIHVFSDGEFELKQRHSSAACALRLAGEWRNALVAKGWQE